MTRPDKNKSEAGNANDNTDLDGKAKAKPKPKPVSYDAYPQIPPFYPSREGLTSRDYIVSNRYDLAPAETIINTAIDEELSQLQDGQTLVILAGETHACPAQLMTQICTISHLAKLEANQDSDARYMVAYELPFNEISTISELGYGLKVPEHLRYKLPDFDPEGQISVTAQMVKNPFRSATLSRERVFQTLLRAKSAVANVDAASSRSLHIDFNDPLVPEAAKRLGPQFNQAAAGETPEISAPTADGVALRNIVMAKRTLAVASARNVNVVLHVCGLNHVLGNRIHGKRYEQSLASLYQNAGCRVLPVIFTSLRDYMPGRVFEEKALADNPDAVIIQRLDDTSFVGNLNGERNYIDRLVQTYSGAACPFANEDPMPTEAEAKAQLQAVITKAGKANPAP